MNRLLGTKEYTGALASVPALADVYAGFGCPASAVSGMTWCEGHSYDVFGNRGVQGASVGVGVATTAPTGFTANNQNVGAAGGTGWVYDSTGNVLEDGAGDLFTWDAENRMVTGGGAAYGYDADGRRVTKQLDTVATTYMYDATGREALEFDTADGTTGTQYLTTDALGSTRLVTDGNGNVLECRDYLPFGEQLVAGRAAVSCMAGDLVRQQFTGKERDSETGLDYFGARYMSSAQGRFMTPDPVGGELANPQSLNRYTYVLNNPLRFTDPTGLYVCKDGKEGACDSDQDKAFEKSLAGLRNSKDKDVARAAAAYGAAGDKNGVTVGFADLGKTGPSGITASTLGTEADGRTLQAQSDVTISTRATGVSYDAAVGHEGSHVADAQDVVRSIVTNGDNFAVGINISRYQSEQRAYGVTNSIFASAGQSANFCGDSCRLGQGTMRGQVPGIADRILSYGPNDYRSGGKPLSRTNQGGSVVSGLSPVPQ